MRLGIFGGSFDPVHNGHLALGQACQEQADLNEVWFTPTAIQPLKHRGPHATNSQRVDMLNLVIETALSGPGRSHPGAVWRVCTLEIDRGGLSYTVDTLRQIHTELPEADLFFLMGADTLRDVPNWKEPAEIFRLSTPLVVGRAGQSELDLSLLMPLCSTDKQPRRIEMPPMEESSSEIRRRVAAGQTISDLVPPAVEAYIVQHRLYR
jgi:nicotinate-nucleotide adenylyltransferase